MPGEGGPEPVVEVAPQPPALLFAPQDHPFQGLLEVAVEAPGMDDAAEMSGEIVQQTAVPGPQRVGGTSVPELADHVRRRR